MVNPYASAVELAAAIKSKEVSAVELLEMYIQRVEKYDDQINAVVVRDFDRGHGSGQSGGRGAGSRARSGPTARCADDH